MFYLEDRGLAQGCQIESYILIEFEVFTCIELNWMQIKSNEIFDTIWFDSIWTERWTRKILNCDTKRWRIHQTSSQKRFSDIFAILVDNSFIKLANFQMTNFFHDCWGGFWIGSILNQNRIVSKGFCTLSIKNRIDDSKPSRFGTHFGGGGGGVLA